LVRGGDFLFGGRAYASPLAVTGAVEPSNSLNEIGFRCVR
jgi:hypothetical protein